MPLTTRQTYLYTDTCNIWKPVRLSGTTAEGFKKDYDWDLVASSVACKYFSSSTVTSTSPIGRTIDRSQDIFHFDVGQEISDGYIIKLTTHGHPDVNKLYLVKALAMNRPSSGDRIPNYLAVEVVEQPKPPNGVS